AALVGAEVVGLLEIDRIDLRERNELRDVDGLRRLALEPLQLLVGEAHVLVLGELVALDQRGAIEDFVALRADLLLLDAAAALGVEQIERHAGRRGRREHLDRNRNQSERQGSRSDGMGWHVRSPPALDGSRLTSPSAILQIRSLWYRTRGTRTP